ncbi:MAG: hypothetical protein LBI82_12325 [Dysgonamonadaceae bacterium]|jgi:hypothetical protein|nr:hypothetical protein [Dysgonamonadaceae bacterium]
MEKGHITIKENESNGFVVKAMLINDSLWLTKNEIADLFNTFVSTVGNNLLAIFKSGVLREEDVSRVHLFELNEKQCQTTLYSLEALIFVSYRIASFEAQAFRQFISFALREHQQRKEIRECTKQLEYFCKNQDYRLN